MAPRMGNRAMLALVVLAACNGDDGPSSPSVSDVGPVPMYGQRGGNADRGWRDIIEKGYVGCGIPKAAYDKVFQPAPAAARLDRTGPSADLPYSLNAFTAANGVDVIAPNCLQCHSETLNGALVI